MLSKFNCDTHIRKHIKSSTRQDSLKLLQQYSKRENPKSFPIKQYSECNRDISSPNSIFDLAYETDPRSLSQVFPTLWLGVYSKQGFHQIYL